MSGDVPEPGPTGEAGPFPDTGEISGTDKITGTGEISGTGVDSRETAPLVDEDQAAEAVLAALERARAAARARGAVPGRAPSRRRRDPMAGARRSGAHPDGRDPQLVGVSLDRMVDDRGWSEPLAVGGVMGRWHAVVGSEIAGHCRPEAFVDGVLTVRAESTAWATQLRLLVGTVMRRLTEEVGEGVVERVVVQGPVGPSWRRGPRTAPGARGPRDTYG